MARVSNRPRSRYTDEALQLLGRMIRAGRIEHRWSAQELADRLDGSRALVTRIEEGHPGCEIGTVFEAAAMLGIKLFDADPPSLDKMRNEIEAKIALLPKAVRKSKKVNDEF